jgi:PAS domain S-box-containing protein
MDASDLLNDNEEKKINILHLDDKLDDLIVTERYLKQFDSLIEVDTVTSVQEFYQILTKQSYDCILSDFSMPQSNGIEIAQKVLENYKIPFIIYTSRGSEEVASAAYEVGVDDYIRKDFGPSHYHVLAKRIRMVVEKNRAELKVKENEEKFRNLAENSPNMIFINRNGRIVYANKKCEEVMGYSREKFYSPNFSFISLIAPESRELVLKMYDVHKSGEDIKPYDYSLITKDGRKFEVIISTRLIQYEGDRAILGTVTDISEHIRLEEKIRTSEDRLKKLFEDAPDGIVTLNMKGTITSTNNAFSRLTGFSKEEAIGKHFTKLGVIRMKDIPKFVKIFSSIIRGKIPPPFRVSYKNKDGTSSLSEAHVRMIAGSDKTREIMVIARDIAERKKFEDKLHALHDQVTQLNIANNIDEVYFATFQAMDKALMLETIDLVKVEDGFLIDVHNKGSSRKPLKMPLNGKGITVRAVKTGKTQLVADVSKDPDYVVSSLDTKSELVVPIIVEDHVVAALNVESKELNAFTKEDQILLEILSKHVSSALLRIYSQGNQSNILNYSLQTMLTKTHAISD